MWNSIPLEDWRAIWVWADLAPATGGLTAPEVFATVRALIKTG